MNPNFLKFSFDPTSPSSYLLFPCSPLQGKLSWKSSWLYLSQFFHLSYSSVYSKQSFQALHSIKSIYQGLLLPHLSDFLAGFNKADNLLKTFSSSSFWDTTMSSFCFLSCITGYCFSIFLWLLPRQTSKREVFLGVQSWVIFSLEVVSSIPITSNTINLSVTTKLHPQQRPLPTLQYDYLAVTQACQTQHAQNWSLILHHHHPWSPLVLPDNYKSQKPFPYPHPSHPTYIASSVCAWLHLISTATTLTQAKIISFLNMTLVPPFPLLLPSKTLITQQPEKLCKTNIRSYHSPASPAGITLHFFSFQTPYDGL